MPRTPTPAESPVASSEGPQGASLRARVPKRARGSRGARGRFGTVERLATFHALIIASVLAIVVFQFTQTLANRYRSTITRDLTENLSTFSQGASAREAGTSLASYTRSFLKSHGSGGSDYIIVSLTQDNLALGTKGSNALAKLPGVAALINTPPRTTQFTTVSLGETPEMLLAAPITESGRVIGTFLSAGSLRRFNQTRARVFELAIGEGFIMLLASFFSVYILLRRLLGSMRRLTSAAGDIERSGELGVRLEEETRSDEVGDMARTFNAMIEKIENTMSLQRQMVANVSHELRSPLTVARGHLDVLNRSADQDPQRTRETIQTVIEELDHMNRLVERILLLGRSLESDFTVREPIDLRALIFDLSEASRVLAARHWLVGAVPDVVFVGDLDKLRAAILNLVENSVKATGEQDSIRLSAEVGPGDDGTSQVSIVVEDSGPGIAPENRGVVLERFARPASTGYQGSGIGLAIVGAVAAGHGGLVTIGDSDLGGCRMTMVFPLVRPDPETQSALGGDVA